jgi:hypothetical protein
MGLSANSKIFENGTEFCTARYFSSHIIPVGCSIVHICFSPLTEQHCIRRDGYNITKPSLLSRASRLPSPTRESSQDTCRCQQIGDYTEILSNIFATRGSSDCATRTLNAFTMDHLPLPRDQTCSIPKVPYLCLDSYDRGDFLQYPYRMGWKDGQVCSKSNWSTLDHPESPGKEFAESFTQCWLFFGLLHVFFEGDLSEDAFIDTSPVGNKVVHTRDLLDMARKMIERDTEEGHPFRDRLEYVNSCLLLAYHAHESMRFGSAMDENLVLSIAMLGRFLTVLRLILSRDNNLVSSINRLVWEAPLIQDVHGQWPILQDAMGRVDLLDSLMACAGWCPKQILKTHTVFLETKYFYSQLPPPDPGVSHTGCTRFQCLAYQAKEVVYNYAHAHDGCQCGFLKPDLKELLSTLQEGMIPLIKPMLSPDTLDNEICIVKGLPDTRYVAISHVWSDGLGNPHANAMSRCQMLEISRLVQDLYPSGGPPIPFWIDTLCCPVGPKEAKKLAIPKMRYTYGEADQVLVLDRRLRRLNCLPKTILELSIIIDSSVWTSRLWTWQEAVLAKRLRLQFADAAIDLEVLRGAEKDDLNLTRGWVNYLDIIMIIFNVRGEQTSAPGPYYNDLYKIHSALQHRSMSVATDEPLCLGCLVGLDMDKILEAEPHERMVAFWSMFPGIPRVLLFWQNETLQQPGFRWAPKTFLGVESSVGSEAGEANVPTTTLTGRGLQTRCLGVIFSSLEAFPIAQYFWVRHEDGEWTHMVSKSSGPPSDRSLRPFKVPKNLHQYRVALLVRKFIDEKSLSRSTTFTMVFITEEKEGILYVHRGETGRIYTDNHPSPKGGVEDILYHNRTSMLTNRNSNVQEDSSGNIILAGEYSAMTGQWTSPEQIWCVD